MTLKVQSIVTVICITRYRSLVVVHYHQSSHNHTNNHNKDKNNSELDAMALDLMTDQQQDRRL